MKLFSFLSFFKRRARRRIFHDAAEQLIAGNTRYFCLACLSAAPWMSEYFDIGSFCWCRIFEGGVSETVETRCKYLIESEEALQIRLMMTAMCIALNDADDLDSFLS